MSAKTSARRATSGRTARLPFRLLWLYVGLTCFGVSLALLVRAGLGLDPWDVLTQGISRRTGVAMGWVVDAVGALVLLAWIPLRQFPGLGTISNIVLVGVVLNFALDLLPECRGLPLRVGLLMAAVVLNGFATGCYIGARLGPGPRDGLMLGLVARGHSVRASRFVLEVSVLAIGVVLGGTAGIGTIVYALSIGPVVHYFLPRLALPDPARAS